MPPVTTLGWKDSLVGELAMEYKYHSLRALGVEFAKMLDMVLPYFDGSVVVVPLPTILQHIRERGFDHTFYLAKKLAKLRGWRVSRLLGRLSNSVQVGAGSERRIAQAFSTYELVDSSAIDPEVTYLLLDDVWTTGASITAATRKLREAGALKISIAIIAVSR